MRLKVPSSKVVQRQLAISQVHRLRIADIELMVRLENIVLENVGNAADQVRSNVSLGWSLVDDTMNLLFDRAAILLHPDAALGPSPCEGVGADDVLTPDLSQRHASEFQMVWVGVEFPFCSQGVPHHA